MEELMPDTVRVDELTWPELEALTKAGPPVVMLPVGSLEQHGPHMALCVDRVLPEAVAERVAARMSALVAPAVAYGYKSQPKSGGGNHFPGCASLDGDTLVRLVRDVICDFARHGLTRIALFNGHMENGWFLTEAADLALRQLGAEGVEGVRIVKLDYYEFIAPETEAFMFPEGRPTWELEHAAVMETSCMLHLFPHLVRADLIPNDPEADFPPYEIFPFDLRPIPPTGVLAPAGGATAEKGRVMIEQVVPDIAAALTRAFSE
jgi:creatinine amidohydrolase